MDTYTQKTKEWLENRFRECNPDGIYYAHQPIYGLRRGYSEIRPVKRYIITHQIMSALSHIKFDSFFDTGGAEGYKAWVASQLFSVKAISSDLSEEGCKRAREIFGVAALTADIHQLPFKNDAFDVVLCSETLEHVADLNQAMAEIIRVARKAVIITVPHEAQSVIETVIRNRVPDGHIRAFDMHSFDFLKDRYQIITGKMISPRLKKLFLHHFGKRGADIQIRLHAAFCRLTGDYENILCVILKNRACWSDKVKKNISPYSIIRFSVPFHYLAR
ncbi:MAG: hypothetical protein A3K83_00485 [Omnitrophica WOR_2 bacterium RBG_13_44_8b]|nr:MAG: hypothetical protein A3K83_00485 [Omnitrophica WOR_2 bacterium RBG_13_44_8b]